MSSLRHFYVFVLSGLPRPYVWGHILYWLYVHKLYLPFFAWYLVALLPCYVVILLLCYLVLCNLVTPLSCYSVTLLLRYLVTMIPCYSVTLLLCYSVTLLLAELWHAKRAWGAPWVSKSTHPKKFGNHVTVHRPQPARPSVRTTGKPMFNSTLSS